MNLWLSAILTHIPLRRTTVTHALLRTITAHATLLSTAHATLLTALVAKHTTLTAHTTKPTAAKINSGFSLLTRLKIHSLCYVSL
jgi:hypothetical protein